MVFEPVPEKKYWFAELIGVEFPVIVEEMELDKSIVYFENERSLHEFIKDVKEVAGDRNVGMKLGVGRFLSGLRTVICLHYKQDDEQGFYIEHDLGYEFPEINAIEVYQDGPASSQQQRNRFIKAFNFEPNGDRIELIGMSFKYLK